MRLQATPSSSPRASRWEWAQTALLVANLAWTTLCLGGYRADTLIVTTLLTGALVLVHFLERGWPNKASLAPLHPAGWWLLPFLAYALANVLWVTPVRWLGWLEWLGWAQMIAIFWVVLNGIRSHAPRRALFFTLVLLGIVGVLLACYQRFLQPDWIMLGRTRPGTLDGRASGSFGIPNSFAGFLLLLLPAVGALAFRPTAKPTERVWWGWVAVVLLFGLVLTISRGAWLALVVALTVWPLVAARGGWRRRLRFAAGIVVAIAIVGGVMYWQSPKVRARFNALVRQSGEVTRPFMWRGAWQLFRDEPVLGTGAGSYNVLFERHRPEGFRDEPLWAHNEYLNTLSDYGAIGFGLFFGACIAIAMRCFFRQRTEPPRRRDGLDSLTVTSGFGIGLLAFALQMALDFHLKIPALAFTFAIIAALAVRRAWPGETALARRRVVPPLVTSTLAVASVTAGWIVFLPMLRAEGLRQQSRRIMEQLGMNPPEKAAYAARLPAVRAALARATEIDPANGQAWSDRAHATGLWALVEPEQTATLAKAAETCADSALALSTVCNEFWLRRAVARDMQGRWGDASKDFEKAASLARHDASTWYYYADHLSRMKWAREPAEAALAFCLRLDPGNPAGLALRQRLAINPTAH
jgi:O-antigen ligase